MVREQLTRLGGLTDAEVDALGVRVEALPGGPLGWRSRVRYAVDAAGRAGLLKHRSHEVVPIDRCLIAHPAIQELPVLDRDALAGRRRGRDGRLHRRGRQPWWRSADGRVPTPVSGPAVRSARWPPAGTGALPAAGVLAGAPGRRGHPGRRGARAARARARRDRLGPVRRRRALRRRAGRPGRRRPGHPGRVVRAAAWPPPGANLADLPRVEVVAARVETALARRRVTGPVDLVVLDPPRSGAGARGGAGRRGRRPARGRLRGLRPGRLRPGRAHLPRAGLAAGRAAGASTCSR